MHYFVVLLLMCNCAPFKVKRFVKMAFKFLGYPCFKCFIEVIKFCLYIPLSCSSLQKLSLKSRLESGYCRIGGQGPHIWEYLNHSWTSLFSSSRVLVLMKSCGGAMVTSQPQRISIPTRDSNLKQDLSETDVQLQLESKISSPLFWALSLGFPKQLFCFLLLVIKRHFL